MFYSYPPHFSTCNAIIDEYILKLKEETGFDYKNAEMVFAQLGNTPGIYPDVCLLFKKLIEGYSPKLVVEIGSGFSTLIFSYLSKRYGYSFRSYEQDAFYANITDRLLSSFGLADYTEIISLKPRENIIGDAELVFIDGHERPYFLIEKSGWLKNCKIVIVDDSQAPDLSGKTLFSFMESTGRDSFITYNGYGRTDRVEFISYRSDLRPNVAEYVTTVLRYI